MTITFDPNLTTDRDWIRAALGDTEASTAVLSDEQIAAVLAAELALTGGSRQTATWCLAAMLEAVLSKEPVKADAAGVVTDYSQRLIAISPLAHAWRSITVQRSTQAIASGTRSTAHGSHSVRAKAVW